MRNLLLALIILCFLPTYSQAPKNPAVESGNIIFQAKDKEILEQLVSLYAAEKETALSELMVKVGGFFMGTPYVAHTLEAEEEQLIINLREMDCTTFAENCLAISRTIQSDKQTFEQFTTELQGIRYRNGIIEGYPSRLHYFCDWIYNNQQKKLIEDKTIDIAQTPFRKEINFMSTHPDSYRQLKKSALLIEIIAAQEKEISEREMLFIPEASIAEVENKLMDGDIVGITTGLEGITISHVVILIRKSNHIHLLHASSLAEKVVISEMTLEEYLSSSNSATGIMVARPL